MRTIYLVSCVAKKSAIRCAAADLYSSDWFQKAKHYVRQNLRDGDHWFILSAKYGLMPPDTVAEPYDTTLNAIGRDARRAWGETVRKQLNQVLKPGDDVVFLAGERYREDVVPALAADGYNVRVPMAGLPIGKQKAWLIGACSSKSTTDDPRQAHLQRFYASLSLLEAKLGGKRLLSNCNGRMNWPHRGVYLFFESTEERNASGVGARVVRIGTHAVSSNSKTSLWHRLAQHRGASSGDRGNHRGSVFRLLIGKSLIARHRSGDLFPHWGHGQSTTPEIRASERELEAAVSAHIGAMPFLWLPVEDDSSRESLRKYIERNAIALLSATSQSRGTHDVASSGWLGRHCPHSKISSSGLWNADHVDESYQPAFLDVLDGLVHKAQP